MNKNNIMCAMTAIAAVTLGVQAAQAQSITLRFSHFLSVNSSFQKNLAEPWCAAIEKDSAGQLKCQIYPSMTLGGTPAQLPDQVKNGVADVAWIVPSYSTGRFPRTEAMELPLILPLGGVSGARAMWDFTTKYAHEDYKDFKPLALFSTTDQVISTSNKPVQSIQDIKGLKLRSPSRAGSSFLTAMGAIPVTMPVNQITESISKGVIDGALGPWELLPPAKIDEVTKYHLEGAPNQKAITLTPVAILMNKAKYDGLPAELKAAIDKNSGTHLVELAGQVWDTSNADARNSIVTRGNKVSVMIEADYSAMASAAKSIQDQWIAQANEKGLDGAKLLSELHASTAKYMTK